MLFLISTLIMKWTKYKEVWSKHKLEEIQIIQERKKIVITIRKKDEKYNRYLYRR